MALFNTVTDQLSLPDHVRTSKKQVHELRMWLAMASPAFMGRGLAGKEVKVGESIGFSMSVFQAVHLAAVLLDQKFLNPSFQVPPDQWDRESHEREMQGPKSREELLRISRSGECRIIMWPNPKRMELHDAISRKAASLSRADLQELLETALGILNVDQ